MLAHTSGVVGIAVWPLWIACPLIAVLVRSASSNTEWEGHFIQARRTFWIAFSGILVGLALLGSDGLGGHVGVIVLALAAVWGVWRHAKALVAAAKWEPLQNPSGLL